MKNERIGFLPGVGGNDPIARHWLRQVTLRLRREVSWLWRERQTQGLSGSGDLPPLAEPALAALDLARYANDKQAFFTSDPTAHHLSELLAETAPDRAGSNRGSFGWVAAQLALEPVESFVLALALLPAVDSAAGPVIAACLNESGRGEPTLALAQRLWDEPDQVLRCFGARHTLVVHGLLASAAVDWHSALQMPALVARELWLAESNAAAAPPARRRLIPLIGTDSTALADAAEQAAARAGQGLMQPGALAGAAQVSAMMTVAWLRGAALLLPIAALFDSAQHPEHHAHHSVVMPLPTLPLTLFIAVPDRAAIRHLGDQALPALELPRAGHAERLAAWQQAVPGLAQQQVIADVAQRFRCEPSAIARIGAELAVLGRPPTDDELLAATRADLDLGALAQAVAPRFKLAELMLPPAQTRQIAEVVTAMNNLARVHHQWGTARAWNEGGLAALFGGPPGTGKTMASEAIAAELKLPLLRIDLSQVVNKYIGETEKNLKRLFDAADAADAILFFDEADALFGKRTEVKDAHDRYANLEISYLLERMERFKGLAILATNRRKDLDEAFLRRLRFVIEFPLPGVPERLRIWRGVIPEHVDASELDFDFLAQRFALAGGHIRAIVFQACLQSAGDGAPRVLTMAAVIHAVQREYQKLERASSLDQFGPYAPLVAAERGAR